jgi:calpain family cysteine protease
MRWAFNPIALAQVALSGSQKGRRWPDSWDAVEELFRIAYKSDARAVFYGSGAAPALTDLLRRVADLAPKAADLATLRGEPAVRALEARLANPEWLPRLLAFIVPVTDLGFEPPGAGVAITLNPSIGSYEDIGALEVGEVSWRDPEQGSANDCYLIASMASLAWTRPRTWRQVLAAAAKAGKDKLVIDFNGEDAFVDDPPAFNVPARVPLDANHNWIYAHSADPDETWPALIERAFVMQRRKKTNGEPTVDDYREIGNELFPHQAARMLLGGLPFEQLADAAEAPVPLFPFVADHCNASVTALPTMAWTRAKGDPHVPLADWEQSTLVADHAYSVLGITAHNGHNFVVLRNPHGNNRPVADSPGSEWAAGAALNGGHPVPLDARGVFAIGEDRFNQCFFGVDGLDLPADPPGP